MVSLNRSPVLLTSTVRLLLKLTPERSPPRRRTVRDAVIRHDEPSFRHTDSREVVRAVADGCTALEIATRIRVWSAVFCTPPRMRHCRARLPPAPATGYSRQPYGRIVPPAGST